MKVAFITDKLTDGGKERRLISIVQGLWVRGVIQPVLILWDGSSREESVFYSSALDERITTYFLGENGRYKNIIAVYRILKKEQIKVVSFWAPPVYSYLMIPAQLFLRLRVFNSSITSARDNFTSWEKFVVHHLYLFSHVVNSNCKRAMEILRIPRRKQVVIYNGFQFSRLENLIPASDIREKYNIKSKYVISMAGRLSVFKDWNTHISACEMILDKGYDVTFICMGGGDVSDYQNRVCSENRERIKFVGRESDVESVFAASDIVTLSTFGEGISNSILEGMALAKPIVATEGGGTPEIVEHGKSGFITKMGDADDYASRIMTLLDDEIMRESFGERGLQIVREKFAYDRMVEQFEAMLLGE